MSSASISHTSAFTPSQLQEPNSDIRLNCRPNSKKKSGGVASQYVRPNAIISAQNHTGHDDSSNGLRILLIVEGCKCSGEWEVTDAKEDHGVGCHCSRLVVGRLHSKNRGGFLRGCYCEGT